MAQIKPAPPREVDDTGHRTYWHALPGSVCAFRFSADGAAEELSGDRPMPDFHDGWFWLHFDVTDPRTSKSVQSIPDLPASAKALLISTSERQQLYADQSCAFGVLVDFIGNLDDDAKTINFVQFAVTEKSLVSSSLRRLSGIDSLCDGIRSGRKISGAAALIETIIEQSVDAVDGYAKTLSEKLDDIEEQIVLDEADDQRQTLGKFRRATIRLSRQIAVSLSLINRLEHENERYAKMPISFVTGKLRQRLDWLNTEITALRERAHVLQEEAMLRTADQTNRHLQALAIVATIFLPASLIAGIFGMNVKGLPLTQEGNGFFWSMALLIGASALLFWLLKRSGMLDQ